MLPGRKKKTSFAFFGDNITFITDGTYKIFKTILSEIKMQILQDEIDRDSLQVSCFYILYYFRGGGRTRTRCVWFRNECRFPGPE